MKIAFIGLGNMGGPMALNIAKAGYDLQVFDLDKSKAAPVLAAGAGWSTSPANVATGADVVMTSLPGPGPVQSIALDEGNILQVMKKGAIWIDLSTNNLEVGRKIGTAAKAKGITVMDAPVSGGTEGAKAATLAIYVGGSAKSYDRVKDILHVIGGEVKHLGAHGAGYVAKISQVMLCYLHSIALSEAMMLGVKGGVDPATMLGIIQKSTGRSYVADRYGPPILEGSYDPSFALGLAHKDMKLTLELAKSTGATLPMCEQVENIYSRAVNKYGFEQNHLMAVKLLEEQNDQLLRGKQDEKPS